MCSLSVHRLLAHIYDEVFNYHHVVLFVLFFGVTAAAVIVASDGNIMFCVRRALFIVAPRVCGVYRLTDRHAHMHACI